MTRPVVGISADLIEYNGLARAATPVTYVHAITAAGGVPLVLPPIADTAVDLLARCDALVLTGGDDPSTEPFGEPTDARITLVHVDRQRAESAMVEHLALDRPDLPVLGVCLGAQMMALHAGGRLDQFMPDTTPTHADHWDRTHVVRSLDAEHLGEGEVNSKHKQAVADAGRMRVVGVAHDGVCEAIMDTDRRFYLGVQWHPERTTHEPLGMSLFRRLVQATQ